MLVQYKGKKAFQTVHSQIAKFLRAHSGKAPLNIRDTSTTINFNVFGYGSIRLGKDLIFYDKVVRSPLVYQCH